MDSTDLHIAPDEDLRRVVVTGVGVVSPIGRSTDEFWQSLTSGRSGITALQTAGSGESLPTCGGAVADFRGHIDDFGPLPDDLRKQIRKSLKVMNRETQLAVAAAQQALRDSGLQPGQIDPARSGVSFGAGYVGIRPDDFLSGVQACRDASGIPEFADWGEKGVPEVHPLWLLTCLPNMPSCYIAMYNALQGPNNTITLGDAATNLAVAEGWHAIREGDVDVMVVGGCGHNLDSCSRLHAWHDEDAPYGRNDAATVLRPFDRDRTGTLPAEGAGVLILEELRAAQQRGATLYGEIVGAGSSCVVQGRMPRHGAALVNAMRSALNSAACRPASIGHIQAHGHGSRRVDAAEARAIRTVFGERTSTLPVTAAKSYFGDAGAGSSALELIAGLLALKYGRVFPILNCERPDPDCQIRTVLARNDLPTAGDCFLKTSVTPQGQASTLVVRRAA